MLFFFLVGLANAEPQFSELQKGDPAPFTGRILNDEAITKLLVEDQFKVQQCDLQITYSLDYEYKQEKITFATDLKILDAKLKLRDQRIKELEKLKSPRSPFLNAALGFVAGATTTVISTTGYFRIFGVDTIETDLVLWGCL